MLNLLRGEPLTGPIHVRPPVPASESDVPGALERHLITMGKSPRIYRGVRGGLTAVPSNRLLAFKPVALVAQALDDQLLCDRMIAVERVSATGEVHVVL